MTTLQIEIPEGFEVKDFDKNSGVVSFQPKHVPRIERISTFEQVCEEMGVDPADYVVDSSGPHLRALEIYKRLMLIAFCFQEDTVLDLYDTDQRKWYPWFNVQNSGFRFVVSVYACTITFAVLGPLLSFPTEEISDYVGRTFIDEYRELAELNNTNK